MTTPFLLRLVSEALARGRIAGRVEEVETGHVGTVASAEELLAFLLACGAASAPHTPGTPSESDKESTR